MNNDTDTELLIRLLDGELPEQERAALLEKLQNDPALRSQREEIILQQELIKQYGRKKQLAAVHSEMMAELVPTAADLRATDEIRRPVLRLRPHPVTGTWLWRAAAAVFIIVLAAALYPYFSATPQNLFSEKFDAYVGSGVRGGDASVLAADYQEGNMKKTVADFRTGMFRTAQDAFLAGSAFLQLNEPASAAEAFFEAVKANEKAGTHYLESETRYYLALSWMAGGQPQKALPLFTAIRADRDDPYHQKISWWYLQKVKRLASR